MRRTLTVLLAVLVTTALVSVTTPTADAAGHHWNMQQRFAREVTAFGDQDSDAYSIKHVYELQYRLTWAGIYHGPITGHFGTLTRGAVKRFQKQAGLKVTGVANHVTWRELIQGTIRARGLLPTKCKGLGWHLCYDRMRHQATLWHNGVLWNSWLARSGDIGYETRTGDFSVYYRDIDHISRLYGSAMPFSQFFSGGQAFHGSPFMTDPWVDHSHGCINMYIKDARQLWSLTSDKTLRVSVYGAWD